MEEKLYSRYLLEEHPITFHASLAQAIGLNEAIMLQKINLWLNCRPKEADGRSWIYNSYKSWQEQLPFWSESTIRRILKSLIDQKLIITANYNKAKFDKTIWYSIDYAKVDKIVEGVNMNNRCVQNEQTMCSNWTDANVQIEQTNTNDYTMITNNEKERKKKKPEQSYNELIEDFTKNEELKNTLLEFIKMRKLIKKPLTNYALQLMLKKLKKMSLDEDTQIGIINQSITKGWQDIYELKEAKKENKQQQFEKELEEQRRRFLEKHANDDT